MGLTPNKKTTGAGIPVFSKIIEVLTGGFTLQTEGFTTGAILPEGSFVRVNELARTATPIKTAVLAANGGGTQQLVEKGHFFNAGDRIALTVGGKAYKIARISEVGANTRLHLGTAIDNGTTGDVLFESSHSGATHGAFKTVPNALTQFDVLIESDASVSAVIRGTAYANRVQKHKTGANGHRAQLPLIFFSESL